MLEHPGIVKVLLFYFYFLLLLKFLNVQLGGRQHLHTENDPFYIVVGEWGDLQQRLNAGDQIVESTVKFYFLQLVLALKFIHDKGIVHRNVKPETY
jgi:serine/threonine protein kinase